MALWQKVKELDTNSVKEILQVYSTHNIPIELRDLCAVWIEGSIEQSSAEKFCIGLRKQIQDKLQNAQVPFYVIGKLLDFQSSISTCDAAVLTNIYKRFHACVKAEKCSVSRFESPDSVVQARSPTTSEYSASNSPGQFAGRLRNASLDEPSTPVLPEHLKEPTEVYSPETFLHHPAKINIDRELQSIGETVNSLEQYSNNFTIKLHEMKQLQDLLRQLSTTASYNGNGAQVSLPDRMLELQVKVNGIKAEIVQMAPIIAQQIFHVRGNSATLIQHWIQIKNELDIDLSSWTTQQKLNANGKPMIISIRRLQNVAEYLMEIAWKVRSHLLATNKVRMTHPILMNYKENCVPNESVDFPQQIFTITALMKRLVQDTFLVEHQPCQVLKTNTRFHVLPGRNPMEVSLLVGEKLGLQLSPPSVTVCIVDEQTCKEIHSHGLEGSGFNKVIKKGKLLPENMRLDFCQQKKCSSAVFRQISLKDFFRNARSRAPSAGREQMELVTEEKFALLFRSEFSVGDIQFQAWRLSLPIAITTHGSQESLAWAAVTWDNAFGSMNRIPFQLPDYVRWDGVAEMLNGRFTVIVGAQLTRDNLNYFAERLSIYPGFPDRLTWSEVCKNCLPGKRFTFWDWFYEGTKLVEQHLKEAWKDGYVKGFIGKELSENMLCRSGCLPGTFLLRFSESTLGGISIVWLHSDGSAYSLAPFKSKDLATQPLVEKINQETLHYVYPNTRKEEAFRKYYEEYEISRRADESGNGIDKYIKFKTQVVIDDPNLPRFEVHEPRETNEPDWATDPPTEDFHIDIDELLNACMGDDSSQDEVNNLGETNEPAATAENPLQSDSCDDNEEPTYYHL